MIIRNDLDFKQNLILLNNSLKPYQYKAYIDMNYFFLTDDEKEKKKLEDTYKSSLSNNAKGGNINLLEYSYLLDFYETKGTIVNVSWYIDLINKIENDIIAQTVVTLFPKLFKLTKENKIQLIVDDLTKKIIREKKDYIKFTQDQNRAELLRRLL